MARLSEFERITRQKINKTVRTVARNIMNDLADAGPVWGGEFRDSWVAKSMATGAEVPAVYPYKLKDIPELPITKREMARVTKFVILNQTQYAMVALDLEAPKDGQKFVFPGYGPIGDIVSRGTRPEGGKRGDVRGSGNNRSTAPLDWYLAFVGGGKMQRATKRGITAGFR